MTALAEPLSVAWGSHDLCRLAADTLEPRSCASLLLVMYLQQREEGGFLDHLIHVSVRSSEGLPQEKISQSSRNSVS
jgi:hypothetical protein